MISVIVSCNSKEYRACGIAEYRLQIREILLFSSVYVAQLDVNKDYRTKYRLQSRCSALHYYQSLFVPLNNNIFISCCKIKMNLR